MVTRWRILSVRARSKGFGDWLSLHFNPCVCVVLKSSLLQASCQQNSRKSGCKYHRRGDEEQKETIVPNMRHKIRFKLPETCKCLSLPK